MTKKTAPASATPAPAADKPERQAKTSSAALFPKAREERRNAMTHTQIEEHVAAFERAGGRIEVLGNTHTFKKLNQAKKPPEKGGGDEPKPAE